MNKKQPFIDIPGNELEAEAYEWWGPTLGKE